MQPDEDITQNAPDSTKGVRIGESAWEIVRRRAFDNRTSIREEVEAAIVKAYGLSATATKVA